MPDDEHEWGGAERVADALEVEMLMGWDGDRCACVECDCSRFADGASAVDSTLCAPCLAGDHWPADG